LLVMSLAGARRHAPRGKVLPISSSAAVQAALQC